MLSIDQPRLRMLIGSGALPVVQLGDVKRIPMTAIQQLVEGLGADADALCPSATTTLTENELMTPPEVSALLTVPVSTLYSWRHERKGPQAIKVGRHLRWRRRDVEAWLDRAGQGHSR